EDQQDEEQEDQQDEEQEDQQDEEQDEEQDDQQEDEEQDDQKEGDGASSSGSYKTRRGCRGGAQNRKRREKQQRRIQSSQTQPSPTGVVFVLGNDDESCASASGGSKCWTKTRRGCRGSGGKGKKQE
ncbi:MAG: hypothetical protein EBQ92_00990, partial [Proteobacteria bacterium]|nr:hypothetical protein [Pseudomonadota bacterium]